MSPIKWVMKQHNGSVLLLPNARQQPPVVLRACSIVTNDTKSLKKPPFFMSSSSRLYYLCCILALAFRSSQWLRQSISQRLEQFRGVVDSDNVKYRTAEADKWLTIGLRWWCQTVRQLAGCVALIRVKYSFECLMEDKLTSSGLLEVVLLSCCVVFVSVNNGLIVWFEEGKAMGKQMCYLVSQRFLLSQKEPITIVS